MRTVLIEMIKKLNGIFKDTGDFELYCDSCHMKILECVNLKFMEGQELVYAPLLCELCGKKHSQSIGEDQKKIQELETKLKRADEKLEQVRDFLEGRVTKLQIRKEELQKRLETL